MTAATILVGPGEPADIAVVVVTYNSGDDVDGLIASVRAQAGGHRIRLIVADNSSSDDTCARVRAHHDVVLVDTGGNLGFAGGVNAAVRHAGDVEAVLLLN